MKFIKYIAVSLLAAGILSSCAKEFLDTEYTRYLGSEEAAEAAGENPDVFLNGMWSFMAGHGDISTGHDCFNFMAIMMMSNVEAQDMALASSHFFIYDYQFDYRAQQYVKTRLIWSVFYSLIDKANAVITLYPDGGKTAGEKALYGQALAVRGMSYYYLVLHYQHVVDASGKPNLYAPAVPIIYTAIDGKTEAEMEAAKGRNTVADVYAVIEKDLEGAVKALSEAREDGFERANKNYIDVDVANGLLARYYLLSQQWQKAADAAHAAHQNYTIMSSDEIMDGFMNVANHEWMWGFNHTTETSTIYASFFSHISSYGPGYGGAVGCVKMIDAQLYSYIPDTDARRAWWSGPQGDASQPTAAAKKAYANHKFGFESDWAMDYIYMRASEMVLIEAEAYAHLGDGAKAATVLKELMSQRQPDWNESSVLVEDVYLQRRIELWGEGFSYFDLKRLNLGIDRGYQGTNHLAGCRFAVKPQSALWLYQIPLSELNENSHISSDDQNPHDDEE